MKHIPIGQLDTVEVYSHHSLAGDAVTDGNRVQMLAHLDNGAALVHVREYRGEYGGFSGFLGFLLRHRMHGMKGVMDLLFETGESGLQIRDPLLQLLHLRRSRCFDQIRFMGIFRIGRLFLGNLGLYFQESQAIG
ncbi:hypothetical protein BAE29_06075 [Acidithiobacillus caldus]|nr:hypothetical protein BAE29_06075 [Acidithiobacillus caldus]